MAWQDMIPEPCMVTLLEKNFFPKWLQVLYTWLTHSPNYEEVTKWYTGWKSMLPASLLAHPIIKGMHLKHFMRLRAYYETAYLYQDLNSPKISK